MYPEKFVLGSVVTPFLLLSIVVPQPYSLSHHIINENFCGIFCPLQHRLWCTVSPRRKDSRTMQLPTARCTSRTASMCRIRPTRTAWTAQRLWKCRHYSMTEVSTDNLFNFFGFQHIFIVLLFDYYYCFFSAALLGIKIFIPFLFLLTYLLTLFIYDGTIVYGVRS